MFTHDSNDFEHLEEVTHCMTMKKLPFLTIFLIIPWNLDILTIHLRTIKKLQMIAIVFTHDDDEFENYEEVTHNDDEFEDYEEVGPDFALDDPCSLPPVVHQEVDGAQEEQEVHHLGEVRKGRGAAGIRKHLETDEDAVEVEELRCPHEGQQGPAAVLVLLLLHLRARPG